MAHALLEVEPGKTTLAVLRQAIPRGQTWMDETVFDAGAEAVDSLLEAGRSYPNAKHIVNLALAEVLKPEPTGDTNA